MKVWRLKTTVLNMFNNSWYDPGPRWKIVLWYVTNVIFFLNPLFTSMSIKRKILRAFGAQIGKRLVIKPRVNIKYPWFLEVGDDCWIGERVWIDNLGLVQIKSNVCISQGAMLQTGNHNYKSSRFNLIIGKIIIEDGGWIGAKAIVCPGVTIKSHAVLTAGSVANSDLEAYHVYQGNPSTPKRKRELNDQGLSMHELTGFNQ